MNRPDSSTIPGLPEDASAALLQTLASHPKVQQVWLYGSRAMNRHRPGSDVDLSLEGAGLDHRDLLKLMGDVDDLLLPGQWIYRCGTNCHLSWKSTCSRLGAPCCTPKSPRHPQNPTGEKINNTRSLIRAITIVEYRKHKELYQYLDLGSDGDQDPAIW